MTEPAAEYSIAELRDHLRDALDATERGPVRVSRRGETVAVLVSIDDFEHMQPARRDHWDALMEWRAEAEAEGTLVDDDTFENLRDPDPGREIDYFS